MWPENGHTDAALRLLRIPSLPVGIATSALGMAVSAIKNDDQRAGMSERYGYEMMAVIMLLLSLWLTPFMHVQTGRTDMPARLLRAEVRWPPRPLSPAVVRGSVPVRECMWKRPWARNRLQTCLYVEEASWRRAGEACANRVSRPLREWHPHVASTALLLCCSAARECFTHGLSSPPPSHAARHASQLVVIAPHFLPSITTSLPSITARRHPRRGCGERRRLHVRHRRPRRLRSRATWSLRPRGVHPCARPRGRPRAPRARPRRLLGGVLRGHDDRRPRPARDPVSNAQVPSREEPTVAAEAVASSAAMAPLRNRALPAASDLPAPPRVRLTPPSHRNPGDAA